MFDQILDVTLPEEKVSTTRVTQGNIKIFLRPNSPDSHQTQIQEGEILDWPHVLISLKENFSTRKNNSNNNNNNNNNNNDDDNDNNDSFIYSR